MITPKEGFAYYRKFLDYLGEHLGRHVQLVDRENYAEINQMIRDGDVDLAFVCGGPYVAGHDEFKMELLVAPQAYGQTVYYSYIIAPKDSPAASFADLRGKKFAFTDPMSNSGKLVPTHMLARMQETPDTFFSRYDFAWSHDKAIQAVAYDLVDGAAVDSLIWEYLNAINPELTSRAKVVEKSIAYGIPPVVVRPELPSELKEELRRIFLNAHLDEKGRAILKMMMIDKFVPIDDAAYDSIRDLKAEIAVQPMEER
jgi:phosphonate transport system substrate-binding protein